MSFRTKHLSKDCAGPRPEQDPSNPEALRAGRIVDRLERMPLSSWHLRARMVVGSATLFDAVDTLAIAYVLPVLVDQWHLSAQQVGSLIAAGYLGQLVGAIFFGLLAERVGRRTILIYTVATYSILSLICASAWDYGSLLVFRTLQGLGLGGEVPVAAAYISEFAKARGRGRFFLLYEQVYSAGRVVAALLGIWMVLGLGWRSVFLCGGLSALLVLILRRFLPESPRWLASRGRLDEADQVVGKIEARILAEGRTLDPLPEVPSFHLHPRRAQTDLRELFSVMYRSRTLTTWALWFVAYLLMNGLSTWVPTLYRVVFRLPVQVSLNYGLVSSLAGFAGCLTVAFLIDWTGRRLWFALAFFFAAVSCLALWRLGPGSAAMVLMFTSITIFFINSNAMLLFLHTSEIYPTRMRALATSVASAWMRVASITGPILIGWTLGYWHLGAVFLQFGLVALLGAAVAWQRSVETKERILEEISP